MISECVIHAIALMNEIKMMSDDQNSQQEQIIAALKLLGALLRLKPSAAELNNFFQLIDDGHLSQGWPLGLQSELTQIEQQLVMHKRDKELDLHWQRLFIGPEHLCAPPWGSVYLDPEQIVFGESCLELAQFLTQQGIVLNTGMNEPEDHIGLMYWYLAGLLEKNRYDEVKLLLSRHMLPWSYRYLELLNENAQVAYFEGVAALAKLALETFEEQFEVKPEKRNIYF